MSLSYNGTEPQSITWNGADVQTVTYNGVEVWSAHPPFLVRMRYDANEATHVKDLVGGYTITTNTGGAVPAAADPFGGNNALNLNDIWISYGGNKAVQSNSMTVTCWVKVVGGTRNVLITEGAGVYNNLMVEFYLNNSWDVKTNNTVNTDMVGGNKTVVGDNKWHFFEFSFDGTLCRAFVDGILDKTWTNSNLTTYNYFKTASSDMWVGQFPWSPNYNSNKFKGHIYDFCILNGVWHTENYNVPTAYI